MILFIDDESRHMGSYRDELKLSGCEVVFESDTDGAWEFFEKNTHRIELIILDIMMPPGKSFEDADTEEGRRTGVHFYHRVRERAPELPVIILTNVADDDLMDSFRDDENCWYFEKMRYMPFEIAREVKRILAPMEIDIEGGRRSG